MSAYTNFYIKNGEDYIAIGSYSRNSYVAIAFDREAPWDEGRVLTPNIIKVVRASVKDSIQLAKDNITALRERKKDVATFENTVDEKIDALQNIDSDINRWEEEVDSYTWVMNYCQFLEDIYDPYMNEEIEIIFGVEFYPVDYDG